MARPRQTYRPTYSADPIAGLTRQKDGRWRCIECGHRWTQADERQAIAAYREHRRREHDDGVAIAARIDLPLAEGDGWSIGRTATADLWAYVRHELLERPAWVAEQVGIAEVARLADLPMPKPSPKLADLIAFYLAAKGDIRKAERKRSETYFGEFSDFMVKRGVETAKGITHEVCSDWETDLATRGKGKSDSWRRHRINTVRTVFNFAQTKGKDVRQAVDALKAVEAPAMTIGDACPIARADFRKLLDAAAQAEEDAMRAVMLISLNGGFYAAEALRLLWDEVDLDAAVIVTRRNKRKKVIRVCTLWPETVDALRKLPNQSAYVFPADRGGLMHYQTLNKRFTRLCEAAGVEGVTFSHLRDGTATAAYQAGISPETVKVLVGHRQGMTDHYVKRNPQMVRAACDAVYAAYMK